METAMMPNVIKDRLQIRDSMRLLAAADIVLTFSAFKQFSRSEVLREFSEFYSAKCLDRALSDLEAGSALRVLQSVKRDVSAGALYSITPTEQWHPRSRSLAFDRRQRHGRGGCRQIIETAIR